MSSGLTSVSDSEGFNKLTGWVVTKVPANDLEKEIVEVMSRFKFFKQNEPLSSEFLRCTLPGHIRENDSSEEMTEVGAD